MKIGKLIEMSREGHQEAIRLGLDREENWTPLLIHLHSSRMLIGLLLGIFIGYPIGFMVAFLILR